MVTPEGVTFAFANRKHESLLGSGLDNLDGADHLISHGLRQTDIRQTVNNG